MAARVPLRFACRHLNRAASRRNFRSNLHFFEAQNLTMPAMSPTMTEGNILNWKVKEGDSFSTGDILLEIETDKATIDVEAQDDGVMAKILQTNGAKGIQVGSRIAVLAEPGDDVNSLEIPPDDSKEAVIEDTEGHGQSQASEPQNSKPAPSQPSSKSTTASSKPPAGAGQNKKYPLYPAVAALVRQIPLSDSEISKIPATGPSGRLLKGDVLSYLGHIEANYSSMQSKRIKQLTHLDLSNIQKAAPAEEKANPEPAKAASVSPPKPPAQTSISLPISLAEVLKVQKRIQDTLNTSMPLSNFLTRAVDLANDELPKSKDAPASPDELFNAVLGLSTIPKTSRGGYLPQITAFTGTPLDGGIVNNKTSIQSRPTTTTTTTIRQQAKKSSDIIDILSGNSRSSSTKPTRPMTSSTTAQGGTTTARSNATPIGAVNHFTLTVPVGEEKRARIFLERVKTVLQVEPGRLVL